MADIEVIPTRADWRALIADDGYAASFQSLGQYRTALLAALAQPEPVGPTESDVTELFYRQMGEGYEVGFENAIAEALARWGRPAIQPVPVSERLPGAEDCDADGFCWFWDLEWSRWQPGEQDQSCTHWLPAHALPIPTSQEVLS